MKFFLLISFILAKSLTADSRAKSCSQSAKMDLQLIVDSSGSVGVGNFGFMMNGIADGVIEQFDIGQSKTRVALFKYSSHGVQQNEFPLNKQQSKAKMQEKIKNTEYAEGYTMTALAMENALISFIKNRRPDKNVPKVCLVFTDGEANDQEDVKAASKKWADAGVTVFAIGIGRGIDEAGLTEIAGNKLRAIRIENFRQVGAIAKTLLEEVCKPLTENPGAVFVPDSEQVIVYENTQGRPDVNQWFGWQDNRFANKEVELSFQIKFYGTCPPKSANFGMKFYGKVYNDFMDNCVANKWMFVSKKLKLGNSWDWGYVLIIFDSIAQKQKVAVANVKFVVPGIGNLYAIKPNGQVDPSLKIMAFGKAFPSSWGVGKMTTYTTGKGVFFDCGGLISFGLNGAVNLVGLGVNAGLGLAGHLVNTGLGVAGAVVNTGLGVAGHVVNTGLGVVGGIFGLFGQAAHGAGQIAVGAATGVGQVAHGAINVGAQFGAALAAGAGNVANAALHGAFEIVGNALLPIAKGAIGVGLSGADLAAKAAAGGLQLAFGFGHLPNVALDSLALAIEQSQGIIKAVAFDVDVDLKVKVNLAIDIGSLVDQCQRRDMGCAGCCGRKREMEDDMDELEMEIEAHQTRAINVNNIRISGVNKVCQALMNKKYFRMRGRRGLFGGLGNLVGGAIVGAANVASGAVNVAGNVAVGVAQTGVNVAAGAVNLSGAVLNGGAQITAAFAAGAGNAADAALAGAFQIAGNAMLPFAKGAVSIGLSAADITAKIASGGLKLVYGFGHIPDIALESLALTLEHSVKGAANFQALCWKQNNIAIDLGSLINQCRRRAKTGCAGCCGRKREMEEALDEVELALMDHQTRAVNVNQVRITGINRVCKALRSNKYY